MKSGLPRAHSIQLRRSLFNWGPTHLLGFWDEGPH